MDQALVIPPGDFRAYLFDLDGTVADSMPLHFLAWTQAVEEHGGTFPEELFYAWGGIPVQRTVELLNERFGYTINPASLAARKEELYFEHLPELKPVASVLAEMKRQHGTIPFAIVSGSTRESIATTLVALELTEYFKVVVGAEDYSRGKPDPEPFLKAAALLGVAPEQCLVFEDAEAGIKSAGAAGMAYVRIPQPRMTPAKA